MYSDALILCFLNACFPWLLHVTWMLVFLDSYTLLDACFPWLLHITLMLVFLDSYMLLECLFSMTPTRYLNACFSWLLHVECLFSLTPTCYLNACFSWLLHVTWMLVFLDFYTLLECLFSLTLTRVTFAPAKTSTGTLNFPWIFIYVYSIGPLCSNRT